MDSERFFLRASLFYALRWSTITTVFLVFLVRTAGLNPLQMVLVGTVLEATVFLFEIPTGMLADAVSRRLSVVIGHAMTGIAFLIAALFPTFWMILLLQMIWGAGAAFISGAYAAWLTDEVGVTRSGSIFLRGAQQGQIGAFIGILVSVAFAQVSLQLPILIGSAGIVALSVAILVWMRETGFAPDFSKQRSTWNTMTSTFRSGLAQFALAPLLGIIFAITLIYGAFSEGLGRLTYLMSALRPEGFPTIATFYLVDAPTLRKRISRASSALAEPLGCNLMPPAGVADAAQGSETCLRGTKFWRN